MIFSTRDKIAIEYSQGSTDVVCMRKMLHTLECLKYWVSTSQLAPNNTPAGSLHCRKGTPKWESSQNMPQRSMILHCHYVQTEPASEKGTHPHLEFVNKPLLVVKDWQDGAGRAQVLWDRSSFFPCVYAAPTAKGNWSHLQRIIIATSSGSTMEAGNSHCFYFTDKKTKAKTGDEYRVRVSSEQKKRTQAVVVLWIPMPPCQLLSPLLTWPLHADLSLVCSHSSRSSNACTWRHLAPSNNLTSAPPVASLVEFKTKAAKMLSASQNGKRLRLVDTWSVL